MSDYPKEIWPFILEPSHVSIYPHLFYGFFDSGGIVGNTCYPSRELAIAALQPEYDEVLGTLPADLGMYAVTVLSGREYVDTLKDLIKAAPDAAGELAVFGTWSSA